MPKCTTCSARRKKTGRCKDCRGINKLVRLILRHDFVESEREFEKRRAAEREGRLTVVVPRGI